MAMPMLVSCGKSLCFLSKDSHLTSLLSLNLVGWDVPRVVSKSISILELI